ncbi:transcriptional regulator, TetR family [Frankineae bacterium MT45]|nr:transcriptional regulator, TetR family [Frankineae bacterium MT45]
MYGRRVSYETQAQREHTGRRRNEAAREAILEAAADLLATSDSTTISVASLAAAAGVGRQTIYRWWPSKGAVLLEAMTLRARAAVPRSDAGSLAANLSTFVLATFREARRDPTRRLLRSVMAESLRDEPAARSLAEFTAGRRAALRAVFDAARDRGETSADLDVELLIDQVFGLLWYRTLIEHAPLTDRAARALATGIARQATG